MASVFDPRVWKLAHGRQLELGPKSVIMGIVNVTPDSFSDGGEADTVEKAVARAKAMMDEGAQIIDVGGESTKPGAEPVSAELEQKRVLPVIKALAKLPDILISVDTYRAATARLGVEAGAHIINDVWGCQKDPDMAATVKQTGAGVCAMHNGRERTKLDDVIADQRHFLDRSIEVMQTAGINTENIVLDPGFGFAKDPHENIMLLARLGELTSLGFPLLIGTSRKRFIGHFTGKDAQSRDIGTAATSVVARMKGGAVFRVHDISSNHDALAIADAVISNGAGEN